VNRVGRLESELGTQICRTFDDGSVNVNNLNSISRNNIESPVRIGLTRHSSLVSWDVIKSVESENVRSRSSTAARHVALPSTK